MLAVAEHACAARRKMPLRESTVAFFGPSLRSSLLACLMLLLISVSLTHAVASSIPAVTNAPENDLSIVDRTADERPGLDASTAPGPEPGLGRGSTRGAEREQVLDAQLQLDDTLQVDPDSIVASIHPSRPQPSIEDGLKDSTSAENRRELLERTRYHKHRLTASASSFASLLSNRPADDKALYIVYLNTAPSILTYRGGIAGLKATATSIQTDDDGSVGGGNTEDKAEGDSGVTGGSGGNSGRGMAEIKSFGGDGWRKAKRAFQVGLTKVATTAAAAVSAAAAAVNTDGPPRSRPDVSSAAVQEFSQFLKDSHRRLISSVGLPASRIVHSYRYLVNAFSARLTAAEAAMLRKQSWAERVERSRMVRAATTHTPDFLRLPTAVWPQLGGESRAGEDVIIGLIDSGIWPEHPAFSDKTARPYGPPPARWRGRCNTTKDFPRCSRKIIGAQWFVAGLRAEGGTLDPTFEFLSPRDANSHGSWCAGAAAGNAVRVKSGAQPLGVARGMAPRARLAVYKALWFDGRVAMGSEADVYHAVDRAVGDGVDILSMSVAFSEETYFTHLPLMRAAQAGVLPILVSGNLQAPPDTDGGTYRTIRNVSPYYLTVAASTTDRAWPPQATLKLLDGRSVGSIRQASSSSGRGGGSSGSSSSGSSGSSGSGGSVDEEGVAEGVTVVGETYHAGTPSTVNLTLVDASTAAASNATRMQARVCLPGSLNPALVRGRIVLCDAGATTPELKAREVTRAGGRAIIIATASASGSGVGQGYALDLPSLVVNGTTSQALRRFLNTSKDPRATLSSLYLPSNQVAPAMAPFSSTGPIVNPALPASQSRGFTNDILKPDITGPGVNLLGPMAYGKAGEGAYQLLSGTSMAVPHLAGIAALIMQKYPYWSPAAVKSALMTTATTWNNRNKPIETAGGQRATPWNYGSGHVIPARVLDPGLVYDVGGVGYMSFLAGIDARQAQNAFSRSPPQQQKGLRATKAYDLNLPNICVSNLAGRVTVVRRVTSVASKVARYKARVVPPKGVRVTVSPAVFSIAPGASQVYSVTFTVLQARPNRSFSFGTLTWFDGTRKVRSVLAAQPIRV